MKSKYECMCGYYEGERFIIKFKKRQNKRVCDARHKINRAKPTANGENIAHNAIRAAPKNSYEMHIKWESMCSKSTSYKIFERNRECGVLKLREWTEQRARAEKSLFGSLHIKVNIDEGDSTTILFFLRFASALLFFFAFSCSNFFVCIFASIVVVWTSVFALDVRRVEFVVFVVAIRLPGGWK